MDVKGIIEHFLSSELPGINKAMSNGIISAGLDPWKDVFSERISLGSISLPDGDANVQLEAAITEITGLKSLVIESLVVESADAKLVGESDISLTWQCAFRSDLTARLSGTVKATLGSRSPTAELSGSASITGLTGTGDLKAGAKPRLLSKPLFCVTKFEVDRASISYKDVIVKIDGLGELDGILVQVSHAVQEMVGRTITVKIPPAIQDVVRKGVKGVLPTC